MNTERVINYWLTSAEDDLITAEKLFEAKRFHHCLFFALLFIEKALKALVVKKTGKHALPIHNLIKLAADAGLKLSEQRKQELREITGFNIEARYNGFKRDFSQKATREFTAKWFQTTKEIYPSTRKPPRL